MEAPSPPAFYTPVVVTGAGGRLGRLVVERLVAAGVPVAALDRTEPTIDGALGVAADLADERSTSGAFDRAERALGTPRALVHTVGMWDGGPFADTTVEAWEAVLRTNLTTAFVCAREAVRRMRAAGVGGAVVGIASAQGADRGVAQQAAYSASKAGVVRLVEAIAAEHGPAGIAAVAVAPSLLLFGGEPAGTPGVAAADVAALCVRLCGPAALAHAGATLRAYGSAG
jgi:3-oxoacyl-[acyl-carrier protein] reductase